MLNNVINLFIKPVQYQLGIKAEKWGKKDLLYEKQEKLIQSFRPDRTCLKKDMAGYQRAWIS